MENCALLCPLLSRQKFLERWLKLLWLSLFTFQAPCKAFKEQAGSPASFPILSENNYCQRKWNLPWWNLAKLQSWLIRSCNFCPWGDLFLELAMWPPTTLTVLERTLESINEKNTSWQRGCSISLTGNYPILNVNNLQRVFSKENVPWNDARGGFREAFCSHLSCRAPHFNASNCYLPLPKASPSASLEDIPVLLKKGGRIFKIWKAVWQLHK